MKKVYIAPTQYVRDAEMECMICQSPFNVVDNPSGTVERATKERHSVIFDEDNEFDKIIEDF